MTDADLLKLKNDYIPTDFAAYTIAEESSKNEELLRNEKLHKNE